MTDNIRSSETAGTELDEKTKEIISLTHVLDSIEIQSEELKVRIRQTKSQIKVLNLEMKMLEREYFKLNRKERGIG